MRAGSNWRHLNGLSLGMMGDPVRCLPKVVHPDVAALKLQHNPRQCEPRYQGRRFIAPVVRRGGPPRQPKVEQLRPRLGQHDVGGLQIPVDDPLPVRLVQRIRHVDGDLQRLVEWQCPFLQPLGHGLSIEILHDQKVDAVLASDVMEGADVRVVQGGDGASFSFKPLLQVRIRRHMLWQHLDGDGPVQPGVGGLVDLAHAPRAEGGVDLVGAEGGTWLKWHERQQRSSVDTPDTKDPSGLGDSAPTGSDRPTRSPS